MAEMSEGSQRPAQVETKRSLAYVYVGYAFRYLYLLVLLPFYGRVLGAAAYGRLVAAMSIFQVVWAVVEYGFPAIGVRSIAAAATAHERGALYSRHVLGRCLFSLAGIAAGVIGTYASPVLRDSPMLGFLATFNGLLAGFNLGWYFQGTLRFRTSVMLEVLGFSINLPMILLLVKGPEDTELVMLSLCVSSLVSTLLAHGLALRTVDRRGFRRDGVIALVRESTALFIHRSLGLLTGSVSTYLVSFLSTPAELGWYGAAERIVSVGLSLFQPANQVMVGNVAQHAAAHEAGLDRAFALIRKALVAMVGFALAMTLGAELLAGFVVPLVLGPTFEPGVPMVRIMALLFPFAALSQIITGYVLIPLRHDRLVPRATAVTTAGALTLTLLLGSLFGGTGVAWARVLGEILGVTCVLIALRTTPYARRVFSRSSPFDASGRVAGS